MIWLFGTGIKIKEMVEEGDRIQSLYAPHISGGRLLLQSRIQSHQSYVK